MWHVSGARTRGAHAIPPRGVSTDSLASSLPDCPVVFSATSRTVLAGFKDCNGVQWAIVEGPAIDISARSSTALPGLLSMRLEANFPDRTAGKLTLG